MVWEGQEKVKRCSLGSKCCCAAPRAARRTGGQPPPRGRWPPDDECVEEWRLCWDPSRWRSSVGEQWRGVAFGEDPVTLVVAVPIPCAAPMRRIARIVLNQAYVFMWAVIPSMAA
eukprot:EG_transcript_33645